MTNAPASLVELRLMNYFYAFVGKIAVQNSPTRLMFQLIPNRFLLGRAGLGGQTILPHRPRGLELLDVVQRFMKAVVAGEGGHSMQFI